MLELRESPSGILGIAGTKVEVSTIQTGGVCNLHNSGRSAVLVPTTGMADEDSSIVQQISGWTGIPNGYWGGKSSVGTGRISNGRWWPQDPVRGWQEGGTLGQSHRSRLSTFGEGTRIGTSGQKRL